MCPVKLADPSPQSSLTVALAGPTALPMDSNCAFLMIISCDGETILIDIDITESFVRDKN